MRMYSTCSHTLHVRLRTSVWVSLQGRDKSVSPQVNQNKEIKSHKLQAQKKIIVTMFVLHFDHGISASWAIPLPHVVLLS